MISHTTQYLENVTRSLQRVQSLTFLFLKADKFKKFSLVVYESEDRKRRGENEEHSELNHQYVHGETRRM